MQRNGAGLLSLQLLPAVCAPADGTPLPLRALSLGCVTTQKGVSSRSDVTSLAAGDSTAYCPTARQCRANSLTHPRRRSWVFTQWWHYAVLFHHTFPSFQVQSSHAKTQKLNGANRSRAPLTSMRCPNGPRLWPEEHVPPKAQNSKHNKGPASSSWPTCLKRGALVISIIPLFPLMQHPHCWYNLEAICMLSVYNAPMLFM